MSIIRDTTTEEKKDFQDIAFKQDMGKSKFENDLAKALELEGLSQSELTTTQDHLNSIAAFKNKTESTFEGR
jgi:hypothetical protein